MIDELRLGVRTIVCYICGYGSIKFVELQTFSQFRSYVAVNQVNIRRKNDVGVVLLSTPNRSHYTGEKAEHPSCPVELRNTSNSLGKNVNELGMKRIACNHAVMIYCRSERLGNSFNSLVKLSELVCCSFRHAIIPFGEQSSSDDAVKF